MPSLYHLFLSPSSLNNDKQEVGTYIAKRPLSLPKCHVFSDNQLTTLNDNIPAQLQKVMTSSYPTSYEGLEHISQ